MLLAKELSVEPDLADGDLVEERGETPVVVGVTVCDHDQVDSGASPGPEESTELSAGRMRAALSGVDERHPSVWEIDEGGISLADVHECDPQLVSGLLALDELGLCAEPK